MDDFGSVNRNKNSFYTHKCAKDRERRWQQAVAHSCESAAHLVLVHNRQSDGAVAGSGEVWQTVQMGNKWQTSDQQKKQKKPNMSIIIVKNLQQSSACKTPNWL